VVPFDPRRKPDAPQQAADDRRRGRRSAPPARADQLGRDCSPLLVGAGCVLVGFIGAIFSGVFGVTLGLIAGY